MLEKSLCLVHGGDGEPSVLPLGYIQHWDGGCLLVSNRVHWNDGLNPLYGEKGNSHETMDVDSLKKTNLKYNMKLTQKH